MRKGATHQLAAVAILGFVINSTPAESASVVAEGATVKKLAGNFRFTEGPAPDAKGNIYFTDIPNNRIHLWSLDGGLSTYRESTEAANGLYFNAKGHLIVCQGGARRLVSLDPEGELRVLADSYQGKRFNATNDLWIDPKGGIYFTDPYYGRNRDQLEQDGEHVYYLTPDGKTLLRVTNDLERPNGVVGTPDGRTLYIADHGGKKTFKYSIQPNGTLSRKTLFAERGSDGMTRDERGNIYLTSGSVHVYSPEGTPLEVIEFPERPANVCFGGKDHDTLFVTARSSIYSLAMAVRGTR